MAGPLDWFRKKQKLLLAVFGILLMFTFVITGSVDFSDNRGEGARAEAVVARWNDGKITARELSVGRSGEAILANFLEVLYRQGIERGGQPTAAPIRQSQTDEGFVRKLLLSKAADEQGIRVDDSSAFVYLRRLTGGTVQNNEFRDILRTVSQGNMSDRQLMSLLRRELSTQQFVNLMISGVAPATPVSSWDFYNRLERRISAEMLPFDVDDFTDDVEPPTDAALVAFFDEHKDRYSSPLDPEPGFKKRKQLSFHFVRAYRKAFEDEAMSEVTDEEIAEFYEANKEDLYKSSDEGGEGELVEDTELELDKLESEEEANDDDDAQSADEAATDNDPDDSNAEVTDTAADDVAGGDGADASDVPSAGQAGEETSEEPNEESGEELDEDANEDSGEELDDAANEESGEDPNESANEESGEVPAEESDEDPETAAEDTDAADKEVGNVQEADLIVEDTASGDGASTEEGESNKPDDTAEKPDFQPLDDVAGDIRARLAQPLAQQAIKALMDEAQLRVQNYYNALIRWEVDREANPDLTAPSPPDFSDIVVPEKFEFGEIPLVDRFQVRDYDLGRTFEFYQSGESFQQVDFTQLTFDDNRPNYKFRQILGYEVGSVFGFWKVKSQEPFVPEFDDVREDVELAWRRAQAIDLTLEFASNQAEQAREDGKPLAQCDIELGDRSIIQANDVVWYTGGSIPLGGGGMPRLGSIPGVPDVGYDFMKTLFRTNVGDVGVAMDLPKRRAYLFRVDSANPDEQIRRAGYLEMGGGLPGVRQLAGQDSTRFFREFIDEVIEDYDLQWEVTPDEQEDI